MLSAGTRNRLKYALGSPVASAELAASLGGYNFPGTAYYVDLATGNDSFEGTSWTYPFLTIQLAVDVAVARDAIFVAGGDYAEDVVMDTAHVNLIGVGSRDSVQVTGTSAGAKTALEIAASDVGVYNLNLQGRTSSGSGIELSGNIRRIHISGCLFRGGDQAMLIDPNGSTFQVNDVYIEDCVFMSAALGVKVALSGGADPCNRSVFRNGCVFRDITTDCIQASTAGSLRRVLVDGCVFQASDSTEPTTFLNLAGSNTGLISNNVFHTTVFSTAKFTIPAGVLFANNISQAENPSAAVGGSSGRPD